MYHFILIINEQVLSNIIDALLVEWHMEDKWCLEKASILDSVEKILYWEGWWTLVLQNPSLLGIQDPVRFHNFPAQVLAA